MSGLMKLLIAIPAFNEELSIAQVISEINEHLPNSTPLVINDGSFDSTAAQAHKAGAKVISLPFNVGVGGAMRVAFKYALTNGFDHVIQIDADGQHKASQAKYLLENSKPNSLVIGSRFISKDSNYKTGFARRFSMVFLARLLSLICRVKLTDVSSGFRLCTGETIKLFAKKYPRDYLGDTVESIVIAHNYGIQVSEVAVEMNQRLYGSPSQNFVKSSWYLIRVLIVVLFATFRRSS